MWRTPTVNMYDCDVVPASRSPDAFLIRFSTHRQTSNCLLQAPTIRGGPATENIKRFISCNKVATPTCGRRRLFSVAGLRWGSPETH